jgi:hypothetical protein
MILDDLLVELTGKRNDLAIAEIATARPTFGVVLPRALELEVLLGAAAPSPRPLSRAKT